MSFFLFIDVGRSTDHSFFVVTVRPVSGEVLFQLKATPHSFTMAHPIFAKISSHLSSLSQCPLWVRIRQLTWKQRLRIGEIIIAVGAIIAVIVYTCFSLSFFFIAILLDFFLMSHTFRLWRVFSSEQQWVEMESYRYADRLIDSLAQRIPSSISFLFPFPAPDSSSFSPENIPVPSFLPASSPSLTDFSTYPLATRRLTSPSFRPEDCQPSAPSSSSLPFSCPKKEFTILSSVSPQAVPSMIPKRGTSTHSPFSPLPPSSPTPPPSPSLSPLPARKTPENSSSFPYRNSSPMPMRGGGSALLLSSSPVGVSSDKCKNKSSASCAFPLSSSHSFRTRRKDEEGGKEKLKKWDTSRTFTASRSLSSSSKHNSCDCLQKTSTFFPSSPAVSPSPLLFAEVQKEGTAQRDDVDDGDTKLADRMTHSSRLRKTRSGSSEECLARSTVLFSTPCALSTDALRITPFK